MLPVWAPVALSPGYLAVVLTLHVPMALHMMHCKPNLVQKLYAHRHFVATWVMGCQVLSDSAAVRHPGGAVAYALADGDHSLVTEVRGSSTYGHYVTSMTVPTCMPCLPLPADGRRH